MSERYWCLFVDSETKHALKCRNLFGRASQRYELCERLLVQTVVGDGDGAFFFVLMAIMCVQVCVCLSLLFVQKSCRIPFLPIFSAFLSGFGLLP